MRTAYHEQLAALSTHIVEICGLPAKAIDGATQALLGADLALAEQVISNHAPIAAMSARAPYELRAPRTCTAPSIFARTRGHSSDFRPFEWAEPEAQRRFPGARTARVRSPERGQALTDESPAPRNSG
jgi:hypothetical protein